MDNVLKAFKQPEDFVDDGYDSSLFTRRNFPPEIDSNVSSVEEVRKEQTTVTTVTSQQYLQDVHNPLMFSWLSALPGAIPDTEEESGFSPRMKPRFSRVNRI
jgi:hypothetical protein